MRIEWTEPAVVDLEGIKEYIAISEKAGTYDADEKAERLAKKNKIKCPKK